MPLEDDEKLKEQLLPLKYLFAAPFVDSGNFNAWRASEGKKYEQALKAIHGRLAIYLTDIQKYDSTTYERMIEAYDRAKATHERAKKKFAEFSESIKREGK